MPKIIDAEYNEGRKMFSKGTTLRSIVEKELDDDNDARRMTSDEFKHNENVFASRLLGFTDAVLDQLRGIKR